MARSLKRTLLWGMLLPMLAIVPAVAALQSWLVLQPTREAFDRSLQNEAIAVASFVRWDGHEVFFDMTPQAERALRTTESDTVYYVVLGPDGRLLAGDPPLQHPPLALAADATQLTDITVDDSPLRVAARGVACGGAVCQVRVGETQYQRAQVFHKSLIGSVVGVLSFALAAMLTVVLATGLALRPLQRLSAQVGTRSLGDLRPVDAAGTPREVLGLVDAINRLFGRVREGSLAQQAFLADAAHQLRTPLASLKNEAELALAEAHPAEVRATLQRLNAGASRAAHLSTRLLALARSDSAAQAAMPTQVLDLKSLAAEAAEDWVPRAFDGGVDLGFELESAPVEGRHFLLRELIANLLHNAIEHAGRGARVTVRTRRDASGSVLEVEDDGPGIAATEREAVFERFRRGSAAGGTGAGLGLAIVRDIALGHGAGIEIADPPTGRGVILRVTFSGEAV